MKVAIIGLGFVGNALLNAIKNDVRVYKVDPKLGTSVKDLVDFKPNIIFITVPTPMYDNGDQDTSILEKVLDQINKLNINSEVVVKSTVLPNNLKRIQATFKDLVYNPEFLREKEAFNDFVNGKLILFGGPINKCEEIANFYKEHTLCIHQDYQFTDILSASLIKYSINSFLAAKVIFFNQLNNIFKNIDTNETWESFIKILSIDERLGNTHMDVPGHDNRLGFGGACFPKDANAIINFSKAMNAEFTLLKKAVEINNEIRSVYNDLDVREKEQNIKFKNND